MRTAVVAAAVMVAFLSGCVDQTTTQHVAVASASDAPPTVASTPLTAADAVPAPTWNVGTWFGHHVFFGADDTEGQHYNTIVVRDDGDSYFLASDDEGAAIDEATFDIPILGAVQKDDLLVSGLGGDWNFFTFPMQDGTTWTSTFTVDMPGFYASWDITHVATFNPAIETPHGPRPGFDIVAHTDDHQQLLFYDYVPDLGWYAHLFVYDLMTPEEGDFVFHVMSMGRGTGWTGEYFVFDGIAKLELIKGAALVDDLPPSVPPEPVADPQPLATFTMTEDSTLLYGFIFAIAVAGAHEVLLIDPNGEYHEFQAVGAPVDEAGDEVDLPAVPGEWKLVSIGAGAVWIEVAFLWQLTAAHGEL